MIRKTIKLKDGRAAVLRCAEIADAESLYQCIMAVVRENDIYFFSTAADMERTIPSPTAQTKRIKDVFDNGGLMLVAEIDEELAGYASVSFEKMERRKHCGKFTTLLLKEYRHFGIGTALMQAAIEWCREHPVVEKIALGVLSDNMRAIKLYQKFGFLEEGRLQNEIKRGKDDYVDSVLMYLMV